MKKYLTTGLFSAILGIVIGGAPADAALVSRGFLDEALENYATTTALDLKANQSDFTDLSSKIGDWSIKNQMLSWSNIPYLSEFFPHLSTKDNWTVVSIADMLGFSYISAPEVPTLMGAIMKLLDGWTNAEQKTYLGVKGLNDKIGTLPSGNMNILKGLAFLVPSPAYTYPTTIGDSIFQLYSGTLGLSGLAEAVYHGNTFMGQTDPARQVKGLRQITDEIGTLPSGNFPLFPGIDLLFPWLNQPRTYPTSLAELITAIYGRGETAGPGLLGSIIAGFQFDINGDGINESYVGTLPNFYLATEAKELATTANTTATAAKTAADANTAKIGTLPTEYETVGAALTAIKGIAEDAKAAALAAIPDPKAEGSTGKFVLTVDIVGDNATYRWEKIDREGETTTTTE